MKSLKSALLLAALAMPLSMPAHANSEVDRALETLRKQCSSPQLKANYSINELASILRSEGYGDIKTFDNRITFRADGTGLALYRFSDGDLQMVYAVSAKGITADMINDWNQTKRLSRAYRDKENDPILEADMLMNDGATEQMVKSFVSVFIKTSVPAFRKFLSDNR
jgi:hypothetical protein